MQQIDFMELDFMELVRVASEVCNKNIEEWNGMNKRCTETPIIKSYFRQ